MRNDAHVWRVDVDLRQRPCAAEACAPRFRDDGAASSAAAPPQCQPCAAQHQRQPCHGATVVQYAAVRHASEAIALCPPLQHKRVLHFGWICASTWPVMPWGLTMKSSIAEFVMDIGRRSTSWSHRIGHATAFWPVAACELTTSSSIAGFIVEHGRRSSWSHRLKHVTALWLGTPCDLT